MKRSYLIFICFLLLFSFLGVAQESNNKVGPYKLVYTEKKSKRKIRKPYNETVKELNLSFGWSLWKYLGSRSDIVEGMHASGFGADKYLLNGGSTEYTYVEEKMFPCNLNATYYYKQNRGISLNAALLEDINVYGNSLGQLNFTVAGGELSLNSKIWAVSLNYIISHHKIVNFFIGPTLLVHKTQEIRYDYQYLGFDEKENKITTQGKIGIHIGGSLKMINKKWWFISLRTDYQWAPKSSIGPYYSEIKDFNANTSYIQEFEKKEVSIQSLNIGLTFGFKLLQKKEKTDQ